jgi:hypothetical protein
MNLIDCMVVITLHNGEHEIARALVSPVDPLRVALSMLARRERLEIGDVLKVLAPNRNGERTALAPRRGDAV